MMGATCIASAASVGAASALPVTRVSAGWEWRYFAELPMPEGGWRTFLAGAREDIYFPSGPAVGLKLRNGKGELELKIRRETSHVTDEACNTSSQTQEKASTSCPRGIGIGCAEKWEKFLCKNCLEDQRMLTAVLRRLGAPVNEVQLSGIRVHCRKARKHTFYGEETDLLFLVYPSPDSEPALVRRYASRSVELARLEDVMRVAGDLGVPPGAMVTGYPGVVDFIAKELAQRAETLRAEKSHKVVLAA